MSFFTCLFVFIIFTKRYSAWKSRANQISSVISLSLICQAVEVYGWIWIVLVAIGLYFLFRCQCMETWKGKWKGRHCRSLCSFLTIELQQTGSGFKYASNKKFGKKVLTQFILMQGVQTSAGQAVNNYSTLKNK